MSPKESALISHRIAVLSSLLVESLEEIGATSVASKEMKQKANEMIPFCESMLAEVYSVKQVRTTNYINDLSNKVDTIIRKNYQQITE